jgi:hypothetical protein
MSFTLETGNTGYDVTAESDGSLYASFMGLDSYVTKTGTQFEATIQSNNAIKIDSGDAVINGRHFWISADDSEIVTINSGTSGYNRIDLICIQYEKGTNGVETGSIVVLQGTETSGTPTAPEYTNGDILSGATLKQYPLYQVLIEGINITSVTKLFDTVANVHALQTLVVDIPSFSSLPQTITDDRIDANHVVMNSVLSNPSAQTSDWDVDTSDGSLTISGSISGATELKLYLNISR